MLAIWFIARSLLPYNPGKIVFTNPDGLPDGVHMSTCQIKLMEWAIALYSVMDIVYIFLILLIPSFLHKCKHAKTVHHNYSYTKRQNNQSTWVVRYQSHGVKVTMFLNLIEVYTDLDE